MKTSFFTFTFLLSVLISFSQTTFSSKVIDTQNSPIPFANVVLLKSDNSIYKGTTTDESGQFIFKNITSDTYQLTISFIGFKTYKKTINTSEKLTSIILQEDAEMLNEVEVNIKKPTIKKKIDRLVFNVENTILSNGNAWDVLKNTPSLLVNNEQLLIKNSSSIIILINNKRVYLSTSELKNLLEGTSAQDITSVEIITNPPAKYEAEGSAVLNIKMKKNLVTGYKGSVGGNYKKARFSKGGVNTSHYFKNKTVNLYASYNLNKGKSNRLEEEFINFKTDSDFQKFHSYLDRNTWYNSHNFRLNSTFELSPKSAFTISGNLYYSPNRKVKNHTNSEVLDIENKLISSFFTLNSSNGTTKNLGLNADYEYRINDNSSLQISGHFTDYAKSGNQFVSTDFFNNKKEPVADNKFSTLSNQITKIYNAQIDYKSNSSENSSFETGLKYADIYSKSDLKHYNSINSQNQLDDTKSNTFEYDEQNISGYVSYKTSLGKLALKSGLRGEYTKLKGNSLTLNQQNKNSYFKIFPTFYAQYTPNENNQISVSYGKRISRPNYSSLNPFKFYYGDYSYYEGNPNLKPSISHNFDVMYTLKNNYNFSFYYNHQLDYITEINFQNNTTQQLRYSFVNLPENSSLGMSFSTNFSITNRWYFNTQHYLYKNKSMFTALENNNQLVANSLWGYYGYFSSSYSFLKDKSLIVELNGFLVTDGIQGSMRIDGSKGLTLGITKKIFNNKGNLSLQFADIFKSQVVKVSTSYLNQQNYFIDDQETQYVRLGFRYNFGNKSLKSKRVKQSIDEMKRL